MSQYGHPHSTSLPIQLPILRGTIPLPQVDKVLFDPYLILPPGLFVDYFSHSFSWGLPWEPFFLLSMRQVFWPYSSSWSSSRSLIFKDRRASLCFCLFLLQAPSMFVRFFPCFEIFRDSASLSVAGSCLLSAEFFFSVGGVQHSSNALARCLYSNLTAFAPSTV